ncbi:hypothetical protein [Nocardia sp. NPDC003345]
MDSHAPLPERPVSGSAAPSRSPGSQLTFRLRLRGDTVVLAVRGAADAFTLPLWRQKLRETAEAIPATGGALIVDAGRLEFLSLRTLAALAADAEYFARSGVRICLVTGDRRMGRFATRDPRTATLPIRSTVVAAQTLLKPSRRGAPPPDSRPRPRIPQITADESGNTGTRPPHYLAGQTIAAPGDGHRGTVATRSMPYRS